uniref:Uncharacterized protein n=1 Tax=Cyanothece sp. (strain PCC 7425 / ATCC 29141) TaxID=395961 RepID=B8HSL5_CYAP4
MQSPGQKILWRSLFFLLPLSIATYFLQTTFIPRSTATVFPKPGKAKSNMTVKPKTSPPKVTPSAGIPNWVYPPGSKIFGLSYQEWSAAWWQWIYSLPKDNHPLTDLTGEYCATGQHGPVWFLAGATVQTPVNRTCHLPSNKAIFFPVVNAFANNAGNTPGDIVGDSQKQCEALGGGAAAPDGTLEVKLDGRSIPGLEKRFNVGCVLHDVFFTTGQNIFGWYGTSNGKGGLVYPQVGVGYYVMLKPLKPGIHHLRLRHTEGFQQDVSYTLKVCKLVDAKPSQPDPHLCP